MHRRVVINSSSSNLSANLKIKINKNHAILASKKKKNHAILLQLCSKNNRVELDKSHDP